MKLWVLGSGSKGNAVLLESGDRRILVDAGFAPRTLAHRLQAIGVRPESISDCVLTHDHGDHGCGAASASRKGGWRVHATAGTATSNSGSEYGRRCKRASTRFQVVVRLVTGSSVVRRRMITSRPSSSSGRVSVGSRPSMIASVGREPGPSPSMKRPRVM